MTSPPKSTLELLPATRGLMRQVHRATGTPVLVKADKKLKYTYSSALGIASRYHPAVHLICFDPYARAAVDYLVTFQCRMLLRFFAPPHAERSFLAPLPHFLDIVRPFAPIEENSDQAIVLRGLACNGAAAAFFRSRRNRFFRQFTPFLMDEAAIRLADELLGHICDIPVGMRVDAWIADTLPWLERSQYDHMTNRTAHPPTIRPALWRTPTPEPFWPTASALNAAHMLFWSQRLDLPYCMRPYDMAGLRPLAEELLAIWHSVPAEPENDGELIDRWSRALGVTAWREWVAFESASPMPFELRQWPARMAGKLRSGSWALELDPTMS